MINLLIVIIIEGNNGVKIDFVLYVVLFLVVDFLYLREFIFFFVVGIMLV